MRRRLPAGVRMYTGDDFNYAELIAGDGAAPQRRAAGHLRRHRTGRQRGAGGAGGRRHGALPRHPGADRAAVAPHLPGADALLQDRRGVHGLAERPPGPLRDGRRPAEHTLAAALRRAVPAGRRGRAARAARPGRGAHAARCWRCTGSTADGRRDARLLRRPPLALDQHRHGAPAARAGLAAAADPGRLRRARHPRRLALARPGRRCRTAGHGAHAARARHRSCRATAAAACSPTPAPADDNLRALDEACALGAPCLVLVVGALPGALAGAARHKDIASARAQVQDGIAALLAQARAARHAAGHRAAAPDVRRRPRLHQHAGAGAGRVRRAGPRAQRRARRGGRRLPRLVGPEAAAADRPRRARAAAGLPCLRLAARPRATC